MAQANNDIPIAETFCTPDTFATELVSAEQIGPCVRLAFGICQKASYGGDGKERVIVAKIIIPMEVAKQLPIDLPAMLAGYEETYVPETLRLNLN